MSRWLSKARVGFSFYHRGMVYKQPTPGVGRHPGTQMCPCSCWNVLSFYQWGREMSRSGLFVLAKAPPYSTACPCIITKQKSRFQEFVIVYNLSQNWVGSVFTTCNCCSFYKLWNRSQCICLCIFNCEVQYQNLSLEESPPPCSCICRHIWTPGRGFLVKLQSFTSPVMIVH